MSHWCPGGEQWHARLGHGRKGRFSWDGSVGLEALCVNPVTPGRRWQWPLQRKWLQGIRNKWVGNWALLRTCLVPPRYPEHQKGSEQKTNKESLHKIYININNVHNCTGTFQEPSWNFPCRLFIAQLMSQLLAATKKSPAVLSLAHQLKMLFWQQWQESIDKGCGEELSNSSSSVPRQ